MVTPCGAFAMHIRCPHCQSPVEVIEQDLSQEMTCPSCGSAFSLIDRESTTTHHAAAIRQIGRFELMEQLGIGAFGTVWKARDVDLDRIVAVKIPNKAQLDPSEIEQFLRERGPPRNCATLISLLSTKLAALATRSISSPIWCGESR